MNSKEIFSLTIALSEPWFIREIEFREFIYVTIIQ